MLLPGGLERDVATQAPTWRSCSATRKRWASLQIASGWALVRPFQARDGGLQYGALAIEREELLGEQLARQRPQAGAEPPAMITGRTCMELVIGSIAIQLALSQPMRMERAHRVGPIHPAPPGPARQPLPASMLLIRPCGVSAAASATDRASQCDRLT